MTTNPWCPKELEFCLLKQAKTLKCDRQIDRQTDRQMHVIRMFQTAYQGDTKSTKVIKQIIQEHMKYVHHT